MKCFGSRICKQVFIVLNKCCGVTTIFGKREAKKALLKQKILTAAREIFISQGYETSTIGQIAEKAGVGLGTAYNYFKSKEEIFLLAMAEELVGASDDETIGEIRRGLPADIITES